MNIADNILKECLKNVYYIIGTAYAGKSTMVRMLAEKHGMIYCGENYFTELSDRIAIPEIQPNLSYFKTMKSWQEFIGRTPEQYARWIEGGAEEASGFELAILLQRAAGGGKVIVDTNLSVEKLRAISDYHHVAALLTPQSVSVERFFDREDAEKRFLLDQIQAAEDPVRAMENYRACIAAINSEEISDKLKNSGYYTIYHENPDVDTRQDVLQALETHFGLIENP